MKRLAKCLLWTAGTVALLGVAAHFTLSWALNRESTKRAVGRWLERSTGCRVGFGRLSYGVFPPRLSLVDLRVAKGGTGQPGALGVSVDRFGLEVDLRRGEVTALRVEKPQVTCWEGTKPESRESGPGGPGEAKSPNEKAAGAVSSMKGRWVPLKKLSVSEGRFELRAADGAPKLRLEGIGLEANDVAKDKPLDAALSFVLGGAANPCKAELHAGAPEEWLDRWGEWPLQLRAEALVEDLPAAAAALGLAEAGPLQRPGLWLNAIGTPSNGVTVSGAFTDGQRFQSPDITVNWKGTVRLAGTGPEGEGDIEAPVFRWGAVSVKNGKAHVSAAPAANGGWALKASGSVARVEGAPELAAGVLDVLKTPQVMSWLPGLAERADAASPPGIGDLAFAVHWDGGPLAKVEAELGESPYRLWGVGTADPAARLLDLHAEISASPEETARLAGGRDLEGWMPSRDGCLAFPLAVSGPWDAPRVVPDLAVWEAHLREQLARPETQQRIDREVRRGLDKLHSKDRRNVEAGLSLLNGLLKP